MYVLKLFTTQYEDAVFIFNLLENFVVGYLKNDEYTQYISNEVRTRDEVTRYTSSQLVTPNSGLILFQLRAIV